MSGLFLVHHAPDFAFLAVADVKRPVGRLRDAVGACRGVVRVHQRLLAGESACKDLEGAGRLLARERLERDVVAVLRDRRPARVLTEAIPRTVERDERAALIFLRELIAAVEREVNRRPVRGERGARGRERPPAPPFLPAPAVLGVEDILLLTEIEETVRPAEV